MGKKKVEHHTVVVYSVSSPGHVNVLHQNWKSGSEAGRIVGTGAYRLDLHSGGEILIYRPTKPHNN